MTAEQLVRAALACGRIDQQLARELRGFAVEYDNRNPPSPETRADWEEKRKLLERESLLEAQRTGTREPFERIERVERVIERLKGEMMSAIAKKGRVTKTELRDMLEMLADTRWCLSVEFEGFES